MRRVAFVCLLMWSGCSHKGRSAPADLPPLPPPSPTVIGLLRGHDVDLSLTTEQLTALRDLDESLQMRNRALEEELAELLLPDRPKPKPGKDPGGGPPGGRGMGGGGMGGGGPPPGGGGMGGGPPGEEGGGRRPPDPPPLTREQREHADRIRDEMMENERTFLEKALQLLDATQRERAEQLLAERPPRPH